MKSISVIVPLYNEQESLAELHGELVGVIDQLEGDIELIYVDDGSRDGSFETLCRLQEQDRRVRLIRLRRNFGKSAALQAGFEQARGEAIVTLDADLQDCPSEIPRLLGELNRGADLVSGWKRRRQDPFGKRLASRIFNRITAFLTGVPLHDINCGLKAYRREVIDEIQVYGEMHRYIPVLASYRGFAVAEVAVEHRRRRYGRSKYGATRLLGGFFDLITVIILTRYNSKPLHVFGIVGLILLAIGLAVEAYLTVGWFFGNWIGDRPAFQLGILLLIIGIQFVFFGLLAEMIAYSARRAEDYSVRELRDAGRSDEANLARLR